MLPPAQRDTGHRVQLHARRRRRIDRFEERADDQPQPLHPVCREERHALPDLPRRDRRPGAQGADGLQREPQGFAGQGDAAPVRRVLYQPRAPVPHDRRQRAGRGGRVPGHPDQRQRRLRRFRTGRTGADRALQQEVPFEGAHVQLRDDPGRERGRETRQMGSRGRLRRTARLLQLLFLCRRGRIAERDRQVQASRAVRRCT